MGGSMKTVLIFDLWGDLGHFKKPYTTTSPLSFAFPPRPTIAGIISAIIGLGKNEYLRFFLKKDAHIALRLMKPVRKIRLNHNLIDTDTPKSFSSIKQRTQIRAEYVKDVHYRIYFWHNDNHLFQRLRNLLQNHESVYTLSLGLSQLLANFSYLGEFEICNAASKSDILIDSIIPEEDATVAFEPGKEYFSANIPVEMDTDRIVTEYGTVIYERNGRPILARTASYFEVVNGERILFI
jgi:CRISPR-associated protein Cas5h